MASNKVGSIAERLLANSIPVTESGCWLWSKAEQTNGYGVMGVKGIQRYAHRLAYAEFKGPIPDDLHIDHLCRVRCCINPDHLEAVTCKENIYRGAGLAASNVRLTHCKYGHEYTRENTRFYRGVRHCRKCSAMHMRNHRKLKEKSCKCGCGVITQHVWAPGHNRMNVTI